MERKPEFASSTDKGNVRAVNEDVCGYFQTPNGTLLVICDGMGGHTRGDLAANIAVTTIARTLSLHTFENPSDGIITALTAANDEVLRRTLEDPKLVGMGTTAVVALIQNHTLHFAHVGDSRIYLLDNHQLIRLTKDHSYVQMLVDTGAITEDQAETHPKRNLILRAIGGKDDVPDLGKPLLLTPECILLLCSDGLTAMVPDSQIREILLADDLSLQQKAILLTEFALDAGGIDNISLQLFRI